MKLVTPQQVNRVLNVVAPEHDYLKRLHRKMLDTGFFGYGRSDGCKVGARNRMV